MRAFPRANLGFGSAAVKIGFLDPTEEQGHQDSRWVGGEDKQRWKLNRVMVMAQLQQDE